MKRWRYLSPIIVVVTLLLSLRPVQAKGLPDKLTISGSGIVGVATVTDTALLADVGLGSLEDFSAIPAPTGLDQSYEVTRYFRNGATFVPFDRLHYYIDPAGRPGYIFYDGLRISNGFSEYDGKWFRATSQGDAAMRALLKHVGALPTTSTLPATGDATAPMRVLVALACALVITGALLLVGRRFAA